MRRSRRHLGQIAALFALTTTGAWADIPLPAAFGYIAQTWLALLTFGLSLAVVVGVETVILRLLLKIRWQRAALLALGANVITTVYGFVFWMGLGALLLLAVLIAVVASVVASGLREQPRVRSLVRVLGYAPIPAFFAMWLVLFIDLDAGTLLLFASLVPAFALTTLIEFAFLRAAGESKPALRATAIANLVSYSLIALALLGMGTEGTDNPLLSIDYYTRMRLPGVIASEDIPEVLRIARLAVDLHARGMEDWLDSHPDYVEDHPFMVRWLAERLSDGGHHAAAIEVLGWAPEAAPLSDSASQEIMGLMAVQRRLLASAEASR